MFNLRRVKIFFNFFKKKEEEEKNEVKAKREGDGNAGERMRRTRGV